MILETIKKDQLTARKNRDGVLISFYSYLIGEIETTSKMIDGEKVISDSDALAKLQNLKKKLSELNTPQSATEIKIIEKYLPKQLTDSELLDILEIIKPVNMADVMKYLKSNYSGQYDGKKASELVKEYFEK